MGRKNKPLNDILKEVISNLEKREEQEKSILNTWEKAVGEKAAKHTKIMSMKGKTLIINVSNSSWLYKLTTEKSKIIKKFNTKKEIIKEIQFRISQI